MKAENRELVCISCPIGCRLKISITSLDAGPLSAEDIQVSGNRCPRGERYAREELTDPRRMVTATVACSNATGLRIPVKSSQPVPRDDITRLLNKLYTHRQQLPVQCGQELVTIDSVVFLATRSMDVP